MEYRYNDEDFPQYVSCAEKKIIAEKAKAKLLNKDKNISPILVKSKMKIAQSFWGQAWCRNLESYEIYAHRLSRGRSYVRAGSVVDLKVNRQEITAQVVGSRMYKVQIYFDVLDADKWENFLEKCSGHVTSLMDLLAGELSADVMKMVTHQQEGLFPSPQAICYSCHCLDDADLCKHVAAVFYGLGVKFDDDPQMFFYLRGVDPNDLFKKAKNEIIIATDQSLSLNNPQDLSDLFGIDLMDSLS